MKSSNVRQLRDHLLGNEVRTNRTTHECDQNASQSGPLSSQFADEFLKEQLQKPPQTFSMTHLINDLPLANENQFIDENSNSRTRLFENVWSNQLNQSISSNRYVVNNNNSDQMWLSEFDKVQQKPFVNPASFVWTQNYGNHIATNSLDNKINQDEWLNSFQHADDFWKSYEESMEHVLSENDITLDEINEHREDVFKNYEFSKNNPMINAKNALQLGKLKIEEGDFSGAVLCFEAACQNDATNVEAWLLLGKTQAQNEQDFLAIQALRKCLKLDPGNLDALSAISCSYTNESYYTEAYDSLRWWLVSNGNYKAISNSFDSNWSNLMLRERHNILQEIFLKIIELNFSQQTIDADVQCSLGILLNLSGDYDKAIDCFRTALQIFPNNSTLWNRLGAILANSNRAEEAIEAYRNALQLSPGFVRARYNVGITCVALKAYNEAIEHFLTALNLQMKARGLDEKQQRNQMSDSIWSTLKTCLIMMSRTDCLLLANDKNLKELNKIFNVSDE